MCNLLYWLVMIIVFTMFGGFLITLISYLIHTNSFLILLLVILFSVTILINYLKEKIRVL